MYFFVERKRLLKNEENYQFSICEKIRSFMAASTQNQMLYMNLEGIYSRRSFDIKDNSFLMQYVYNTLYYNEDANVPYCMTELKQIQELYGGHLCKEKLKRVQEIYEKIVSVSKTFKWVDEIHLGTIWIYYFDYEDSKQKATPVFKIYKEKEGNAAAFLDVNLAVYENWDSYLDNSAFTKSFLCVPRNGNYYILDEQVDLEFICKLHPKNNHNNFGKINFKPFSQTLRSGFEKFRLLRSEVQQKIIRFASALLNRLKDVKIPFSTLLVFCASFAIELIEFFRSPERFNHKIKSLLVMLFNTQRSCSSIEEFMNSQVESTFGVKSITRPEYPGFAELFQKLQDYCGEDNKNWSKIFEVIFSILKKARPTFIIIERILRSTSLPSPIFCIFQALSGILTLEHYVMNFMPPVTEPEPSGSSSPENSPSPERSCGNEEAPKVDNSEMLTTFLSKWDLLERMPADSVQNLLLEEFLRGAHSLKNSEDFHPMPIAVGDEFALVYIPGLSLPTLNAYCLRFIGSNVRIRPVGDFENEIILDTGEVICRLLFINHFSAIGLVNIGKNRKIKFLEGLEDVQINKFGDRN